MNKKHLQSKLKNAGLSDKEAKIYLAGLEIGPASASQLASQSDIKRSTVYLIIESLEHKGLMNISMQGLKRLFVSENPVKLQNLLERQRNELESCIDDLQNICGNIDNNKSVIKCYQSQKSIRGSYEDVLNRLKPQDDYLVYGDLQSWYETDPEYFKEWPYRRREIIRHGRSIYQQSPIAQQYANQQKSLHTSVKLLPTQSKLNAIKLISTDFVFIHKTKTPSIVLIIENKSLVEMYKEMFEVLWELLPNHPA